MSKLMRIVVLSCLLVCCATLISHASCNCQCVNGVVVLICTSPLDMQPICPPTICPMVTPSIQPINPLVIPPIGTTHCQQMQVADPKTGMYEWRTICQ